MDYDQLMQERLERFKLLLKVLPDITEIPAELLILSAGEQPGQWSFRHVPMPGETIYFIFRKAGFSDAHPCVWECVDRELNEEMKSYFKRCA